MEVTAAVARSGATDFSIETVQLDAPRPDEILVRIVAVGICHTDLVARSGAMGLPMPSVFGHEGSGIVEAVGAEVRKVRPGDPVVITFRSCGDCTKCRRGDAAYCHHVVALNILGAREDGTTAIHSGEEAIASNFFGQSSFATFALAYERNVVKADPAAPLELLGPLGCGVQTGVGGILRSLDCEQGSSLLILGGGSVGLSAVMGAKVRDCSPIIVVEPVAARRELALSFGATHVFDPAVVPDIAVAVREIAPDGVDYAFDTTGVPLLQAAAMACLASKGTLGVVGITPPEAPPPGQMSAIMRAGQTIRGIIEGDSDPDVFIPELIALHLEGKLPIERMITTYPFSAINQAVEDQKRGQCVKAVLLTGA